MTIAAALEPEHHQPLLWAGWPEWPVSVDAIAAESEVIGSRRTPERGSSASMIQSKNPAGANADNNIVLPKEM
jgi:hypothetical protein